LKNDSNLRKLAEEKKSKIIRGRFDSNEDKILTNNWNKFCDEFNVNEDMKIHLLGYFARSHRYSKEERKKLTDFTRRENFLLRLANGLPNRLVKVIYDRARVLFCPLRRMNQIKDEERKLMKSLHSLHKNKWTTIAQKLNCYPVSVQSLIGDNYNRNGEPYKKGKWSFKENQKFINALKVYLNTDDLSNKIYVRNVSWTKVRESGNLNRSLTHIRQHWKLLRWKLTNFDYLENNWS
jgi:hypothetical protein